MDAKALTNILTDYKQGNVDHGKASFDMFVGGIEKEEANKLLKTVESDRNMNIAKKVSDKFGNSK